MLRLSCGLDQFEGLPQLAGRRPLGVDVDCIERLARGHKEPIALGASEANIAADLRKTNAAD